MDIYVINLDRSTDRLTEFKALNGHMKQMSRIAAADGKTAMRDALVERGIIAADLDYDDGALGNALSHLALWNIAIEKNEPLTVCEDDAIFNRGFASAAESLVQALPQDWHMILWGWNFDTIIWFDMIPGVSSCIGRFEQDRMRAGIGAFQSAKLMPQPYRLLQTFGTVCYSISPAGAQALRQYCLPFRNMDVFIPGLGYALPNKDLSVMVNGVLPQMNAFVSFPPLVITPNDHSTSTIQKPPVPSSSPDATP